MPGVEVFFSETDLSFVKGKRVGIVTNHTGVDQNFVSTIERCKSHKAPFRVTAIFAPEHGINGREYAYEQVAHSEDHRGVPIYSLHGTTRRPTKQMLSNVDVLIYDIQDVGVRSYTYISTLFYVMEEAARYKKRVVVLDRPNPISGEVVDGPLLEQKWRSFIGYINVPFCHGMTVGELAKYFNAEYKVGCDLRVIPMKGWQRDMSFKDTGLGWVPMSPHIPEPDSPLYYATTGCIGELGLVNIGVGYSLPFKLIGAEWIDAYRFAKLLNKQKMPGVHFIPFHYKPFYGSYRGKNLNGVKIQITNPKIYKPCSTQFAILGILKSMYPSQMLGSMQKIQPANRSAFCKAFGTDKIFSLVQKEKYCTWKLIAYDQKNRERFQKKREKYLFPCYNASKQNRARP